MDAALAAARTGLDAQSKRLQVINNNLANVETKGFKALRPVFEDLAYQIERQPGANAAGDSTLPSGLQLGTGVRMTATEFLLRNGSLEQTDRTLDVAIAGKGFFQIAKADGTLAYTRNGSFQMDADGQIVTANGEVLQPAITIPATAVTVTVGSDGTVSILNAGETATTQLGTIQLSNFANPGGLQAEGGNLFRETSASGAAQLNNAGTNGLGDLKQGMLEGSNVNVVQELVSLIEAQRAYEMNSKGIQTRADMLQFISQIL